MIQWLQGNKTYLGMISLGLLGVLVAQGVIEEKLAATIGSILVAWTGVAVRAAWAKGK